MYEAKIRLVSGLKALGVVAAPNKLPQYSNMTERLGAYQVVIS